MYRFQIFGVTRPGITHNLNEVDFFVLDSSGVEPYKHYLMQRTDACKPLLEINKQTNHSSKLFQTFPHC